MSVDEFMRRYNALLDVEWYDEKLKRPLLIDINRDFDDPTELITNNDFMMILSGFENDALNYATDVFGKIDIPLIGSIDFGDLLDTFCDIFNGTRLTVEKIYLQDELEKLYSMIDRSSDGIAYYDRGYFKYM